MNIEQLLNKINVLLISDNNMDYEDLVKYGLKNIVYFKSIIVADKYFQEYPEELNRFNLVIKGHQEVQEVCFDGETKLDRQIEDLPREVAILRIYEYFNAKNYSLHFFYERETSLNISLSLDFYMRNLLKAEHVQKIIENQEPVVIAKPVMPSIEYPKKKSDLKIFIALSGLDYTDPEKLTALKPELNIDIPDDFDLANVIRQMGDYDIIIASECYSGSLINMNHEFTEQGKLTGRKLGLVATYDNDSIYNTTSDGDYQYGYIGADAILKSACGGIDAKNTDIIEEKYKVRTNERGLFDSSIIDKAIINYHEELKRINGLGLEDVVPEEFQHYEQDYEAAEAQYEQDKKEYAEQIGIYDNIVNEAKKYLKNKKKGMIKKPLVDLSIEESKSGITITNLVGQYVLSTLVITQNEDNKNRIFYIQTRKDNGSLTNVCEVALFPIEKKFDVVRPNEKQLLALNALWKKMERNLVTINNGCSAKSLKLSVNHKPQYNNRHQKKY